MKQPLFLPSLILTLFSLPASAQTADVQSPAVRLEQLAVGIRLPSRTNEDAVAGPPKTASIRVVAGEKSRSDSSARSAAHDIVIGAAIGGAIGIGAGIVASRRKQSVEVDIGTTAYVLLGFVCGAILGALTGVLVHVGG